MATNEPSEAQIEKACVRLYKAVANYVRVRGGSVAVAGGVEVQEWPQDPAMSFRVAVRCTGRKPEIPEPKQ